jgi:hypothetical protein
MNGATRTILGASALAFALTLGGCENFDMPELFNKKRPLPGERHAVFPEGVPGAQRGVPAELIKGNQAAEATASVPAEGPKPAAATKVEEKPKPKPKVAAKPAPTPKQASAEAKSGDSDVWPPPPKANAPAQATAAPWPAPPSNKPAAAWPTQ